jgi:hypothetical protein
VSFKLSFTVLVYGLKNVLESDRNKELLITAGPTSLLNSVGFRLATFIDGAVLRVILEQLDHPVAAGTQMNSRQRV